ncbi:MAG: zinc dependent phospholipase C family protein [Ruminococcaceae bacterium]|nr:zinc dependent phospholipase C family protein [Oscillospiraceae bacterium]
MNIVTHVQMGGKLYEELCEVAELDRQAFIYGNIKPDCALKTLLPPHTMTNYLEWVLTLTDCLIEYDLPRNVLSEGLGVLCHFLSDFCCLYHAREDKFHNLIGHIIYEKRLHNHHKKKESSLFKEVFSFKPEPVRDLRQTIINFREEYFSQPHSLDLDLSYAYMLCNLICQSVIYYRFGSIICDESVYYGLPEYVNLGGVK